MIEVELKKRLYSLWMQKDREVDRVHLVVRPEHEFAKSWDDGEGSFQECCCWFKGGGGPLIVLEGFAECEGSKTGATVMEVQ